MFFHKFYISSKTPFNALKFWLKMACTVIRVEPPLSLVDEKISIVVSGLKPSQPVTLEATLVAEKGEVFESHAHYTANKFGEVDVRRDSSAGGSYCGVEPMGLIWSMRAAQGQKKGLRLMKRDVTKPYNVTVQCLHGHINPSNLRRESQQPLSSVTFQKFYMADGVKRIPVREGRIRGTLFLPPGDGPSPGIIDLLGGAGGLWEYKAALLASHGFVALALAFFAYDDLPKTLTVDMGYFEEAADWLSQHPLVLPNGIGVLSISAGSWIALLMASFSMKMVRTVVAISPVISAYIHPFSYKGKISKINLFEHDKVIQTEEGDIWRYAFGTTTDYSASDTKYSAITPVENITCPVLLVFGTGDLNVNPEFAVKVVQDQLKKHGKGHLCSVLCYPGAGHLIEPPYSPLCYSSKLQSVAKVMGSDGSLVWGGKMKCHADAQEDSWPKILTFLRRNLQNMEGKL